MKNTSPFTALTVAFTVAGAAIGYALHDKPDVLSAVVAILAIIGGAAAAFCEVRP